MGEVFAGRYELVDPLGEGGAGVVWRVWDRKHRAYCAAKVLRQVDASSLLRFMREQSLRLAHSHVLAPIGWAGEDDKVLFTMPIVRGGSVAQLVSDFGPLPTRLVAVLLDQLLAALEAIHAENIVHRDVKPANLLLDATAQNHPHLWLGDFGIAAGEDAPRLTQGPYAMGTPGYVAPECLHQGWQPDTRADLYAAGMCAVEMLTGLRPDADTNARQALSVSMREEPVPAELTNVLARLSHHALTERYPSAAHARQALRRSGLTGTAQPAEVLGEVELFDHIPPLPQGWSEEGPEGERFAEPPAPAAFVSTGSFTPEPPMPPVQQPPGVNPAPLRSAETTQVLGPPFPPTTAQARQAPHRRGQGLAIALMLVGAGLVMLAVTLYLALG